MKSYARPAECRASAPFLEGERGLRWMELGLLSVAIHVDCEVVGALSDPSAATPMQSGNLSDLSVIESARRGRACGHAVPLRPYVLEKTCRGGAKPRQRNEGRGRAAGDAA